MFVRSLITERASNAHRLFSRIILPSTKVARVVRITQSGTEPINGEAHYSPSGPASALDAYDVGSHDLGSQQFETLDSSRDFGRDEPQAY